MLHINGFRTVFIGVRGLGIKSVMCVKGMRVGYLGCRL